MSDKNLLIGDTTYPHEPEKTLSERLRNMRFSPCYEAADRIEQLELAVQHRNDAINELERQLIEAQKGHALYEYVRKLTPKEFTEIWRKSINGKASFDRLIFNAAINGVKE